ncbi:MAG: hypothetical protein ABEK59_02990 [Halobacteria archaeon]
MSTKTSFSGNAWLLQRITGIALIVLLGFHFAVQHFIVGAANINAENTQARMSDGVINADHLFSISINIPAFVYQATALLLLGFSVYHGMYGLYNMIREHGVSERTDKILKGFFTVLSIALLIQGGLIFVAFTGGG